MYNISTKGTMCMKYDTLLNELTQDKKGILTTKDAVANGVTKPVFLRFIKKKRLRTCRSRNLPSPGCVVR